MERVPEFWTWLAYKSLKSQVKVPLEILEELKDGKDELAHWLKEHQSEIQFPESVQQDLVERVTMLGYANDLREDEVEKLGRDPFLIAHALADVGKRCVVTTESSRPTRKRANRHVPNVCETLGIPWCNTFELIRELNFTTDWEAH